MPPRPCSDVARRASELVSGTLPPARAAELARHAEACAACALVLARERRLRAWLAALPEAPPVALTPPELPGRPLRRFRLLRLAVGAGVAAAAAVLAAFALVGPRVPGEAPEDASLAPWRLVDDADPIPAWDEAHLGLVAGLEAVASRRLAEAR